METNEADGKIAVRVRLLELKFPSHKPGSDQTGNAASLTSCIGFTNHDSLMKRNFYGVSSAWLCLALIFTLCPPAANAVLTGYLKIDDIPGESRAAEHEDEIDVIGIEWKISRNLSDAGSGRTTGRSTVTPLKVKKFTDKSSPYLALAVLNGRSLPEVTLAVRRDSGDTHLDYLIITMTNVQVTSYEIKSDDSENAAPVEEVGFYFESVNYKYVEQAEDHSAGDEHEVEYDIAAGA